MRRSRPSKYWGFYLLSFFVPTAAYFFPAYSYARWLDDYIDSPERGDEERINLLTRHMRVLRTGWAVDPHDKHEVLLEYLLQVDRAEFQGELRIAMEETFRTFEFDVYRRWQLKSQVELDDYAETMGISFMHAIASLLRVPLYIADDDIRAVARAGCKTYMLRDYEEDWHLGLPSLPLEMYDPLNLDVCEREWFRTTCSSIAEDYSRSFTAINHLRFLPRLVALQFLVPRYFLYLQLSQNPGPRCTPVSQRSRWRRFSSIVVATIAAAPALRRLISPLLFCGNQR